MIESHVQVIEKSLKVSFLEMNLTDVSELSLLAVLACERKQIEVKSTGVDWPKFDMTLF